MTRALGSLFAIWLVAVLGCGSDATSPRRSPKAISVSEAKNLPLEEAGGLNIRQNLAERPEKPVLGHDAPMSPTPR